MMQKIAVYYFVGDVECKRHQLAIQCHCLSPMGEVGYHVTDGGMVALWATQRRKEEVLALVNGGVL